MSSPKTAEDFIELLTKSQLLSQEHIDAAIRQLDLLSKTPSEISKALILAKTITPFQAERLLEGRYRGFFIDCYRVFEVLGVGGMGYVYIAEDQESKKRVVLKVLTERFETDPGMLARFKSEGRAGLKVDHPNVIRTLRLDNTGAVWFLAMDFYKGLSLHELVVLHGPIPWQLTCDYFAQAALGLHHLHENGIIHRDIKPANLLVERDGNVRLLDFGLCMLTDDEEVDEEFSLQMIFGQDRLGTADFIAPEQILNSTQIDARADIYGLGCTMYFILTGKVPFPVAKVSEKLRAHRTGIAKPIDQLVKDIPTQVRAIVEKMMARNPDDRFQTAAEVAAALKPLGLRRPVEFDFPRILAARAREAKKRSKSVDRPQRAASSSISGGLGAESTASSERIESAVRHNRQDSQPARAYSELIDSFSSPELGATKTPDEHAPKAASTADVADEEALKLVLEDTSNRTVTRLTKTKMVIGRDMGCDIPVNDRGVSGQHCQLEFRDGQWNATDLDSTNGIMINNAPIKSGVLKVGDRLTVGKRFVYRLKDPTARARVIEPPEPKSEFPTWQVAIGAAVVGIIALIVWSLSGD